ncbi:hypothetical protein Sru01_00170 [Sphaerisporangium rufum]|uniref:CsbD family protein n=1 Tax=Sphaerisporangium rufum TaxID=1381558 RepID=A0A919R100_9ACTN|nr:hypothetical protein [Sphaerisporangium rufum]GII75035.1 hypothetical protein Sru01_00170 [Sphaerisporangium rufum]
MGFIDRLGIRELAARTRRRLGSGTGNRTMAAKARTDEAEARLLRTEERIKQAAAQIRRDHGVRS